MAYFRVPASGGTIYLDTLIISVVFDFGKVVQGWRRDEAEYAISSYRIVDEHEQELLQLRARFPALILPNKPETFIIQFIHSVKGLICRNNSVKPCY